ncbi:hypothetical protein SAMN05192554_103131 [Haloarchaeobius iranensis]|uniref:Uncharacterized protein n=1 Tax=Haloarchaeobius iranensis TaxID=996166 RepID=A0A1G9TU61_9EURY|nr:hypothetical protein SAMN05192554_103131 [Haloarchaeobius iranensis]
MDMSSFVGVLYDTFGAFLIPATVFAVGILFYGVLVWLNRIEI